ncbi:hypothetical protein [Actinomycetospora flava]|uniref:Uncharacterized protein n=1 Tax=Actinomycetospora flava TaxID=3129232 RepID=A0ABU8MAB1_9PSEU
MEDFLCAICLIEHPTTTSCGAVTIVDGTAMCRSHALEKVFQPIRSCECARLPKTFYLNEAPRGWADALVKEAAGNWKELVHCADCERNFSIDGWDKYTHQVVAQIEDLTRWEEEADSLARRQELMLRVRGGTEAEECVWADCSEARVRGVLYCLDHLWKVGRRR